MAAQHIPRAKSADPAVEVELDRLAVMPIAQLRVRYREAFRADPPKAFGPDLLRRSIAHRIQEKAYGGLSRSTQRLLEQMIRAFSAKPDAKIVLPRRIKQGSVLVREWKGRSHRVMVLADGFAYHGDTYSNLSEIAGRITGTKWNGPRFFGLRSKMGESGKASKADRSDIPERAPTASPIRSNHLGGGSDYRKRNNELARKTAAKEARHGR
jgi:Protein of unknown function (DUF2924)